MRVLAVAAAGLAAAAIVLELTAPKAMQAAVTTLVTITNTPNVNIANTPSVAVDRLPPVELSGTVAVANTSDPQGTPIVLTQDDAARNGFRVGGICTFSDGVCDAALYHPPLNKIAVVQSFSGACVTSGVLENVPDPLGFLKAAETYVVPVTLAVTDQGLKTYAGFRANLTGAYFPNGTPVLAEAKMVYTSGSGTCEFMISGYLVDQ